MKENAIAKEIVDSNAALIKDGISRIVNGLEEDSHAKSQRRKEHL